MLIDDRNVIQHKFGYPSRESVLYYIDIVIDLFQTSMQDNYSIEFKEIAEEYFTETGMQLIGLKEDNAFSKVDAISRYDMLSAISTAYSLLEEKANELLGNSLTKPVMIWHDKRFYLLLKLIDPTLMENKKPREYFESIRQLRNISVHRQHHTPEIEGQELNSGLLKIKNLYNAINEIPKDKVAKVVQDG